MKGFFKTNLFDSSYIGPNINVIEIETSGSVNLLCELELYLQKGTFCN